MEFVETPTFTRLVLDLMEDDDYAKLQAALARKPGTGKIIPGSGGLRKMRGLVAVAVNAEDCGSSIIGRLPLSEFGCS